MIAGSFSQIAAETARDHGFGAWLLSGFGAVQGAPRMRAVSRVRRWRIIQAAERARQAIAQSAIGCVVVCGVMAVAQQRMYRRRPRPGVTDHHVAAAADYRPATARQKNRIISRSHSPLSAGAGS